MNFDHFKVDFIKSYYKQPMAANVYEKIGMQDLIDLFEAKNLGKENNVIDRTRIREDLERAREREESAFQQCPSEVETTELLAGDDVREGKKNIKKLIQFFENISKASTSKVSPRRIYNAEGVHTEPSTAIREHELLKGDDFQPAEPSCLLDSETGGSDELQNCGLDEIYASEKADYSTNCGSCNSTPNLLQNKSPCITEDEEYDCSCSCCNAELTNEDSLFRRDESTEDEFHSEKTSDVPFEREATSIGMKRTENQSFSKDVCNEPPAIDKMPINNQPTRFDDPKPSDEQILGRIRIEDSVSDDVHIQKYMKGESLEKKQINAGDSGCFVRSEQDLVCKEGSESSNRKLYEDKNMPEDETMSEETVSDEGKYVVANTQDMVNDEIIQSSKEFKNHEPIISERKSVASKSEDIPPTENEETPNMETESPKMQIQESNESDIAATDNIKKVDTKDIKKVDTEDIKKVDTEDIKEPTDKIKEPTDKIKEPTDKIKEPTDKIKEPTDKNKEPTDKNKESTDKIKDAPIGNLNIKKSYFMADDEPFNSIKNENRGKEEFKSLQENARDIFMQHKEGPGICKLIGTLMTCGMCCSDPSENNEEVTSAAYSLLDYLQTISIRMPALFRIPADDGSHEEIAKFLKADTETDFWNYAPHELIAALKIYISEALDGFLSIEMSRIIFKILPQENGKEIVKKDGKYIIAHDRLKLLYKIIALFNKISIRDNVEYNDLVKEISPYFFPKAACRNLKDEDVFDAVRLICDTSDFVEIGCVLGIN